MGWETCNDSYTPLLFEEGMVDAADVTVSSVPNKIGAPATRDV